MIQLRINPVNKATPKIIFNNLFFLCFCAHNVIDVNNPWQTTKLTNAAAPINKDQNEEVFTIFE